MSIRTTQRTLIVAALAASTFPALASDLPFALTPTANVQYEWAQVASDRVPTRDADGFRRARLGFRIKSDRQHWQLVVEHDFAGRTPPDAFLEWTPTPGQSVRLGQFKQPFTLEDALTDKQSAFLEASSVGAFAISRRVGLEYARWGKRGTFNAAVFGKRLDGTSEGIGASLRTTWLLRSNANVSAHIGLSLASESSDSARASFGVNPGTVFSPLKLAATGALAGVDRIDRAAIEGLWVSGAWSLQAEAAQVFVRRDSGDVRGNAGAVQLTWSPTGDGRHYKRGVATGPAPQGQVGWELALRWNAIDLNDGPVRGGRAQGWGLAATCYPHPNLRVIADLLAFDSRRQGVGDHPLSAGLRLQFSY